MSGDYMDRKILKEVRYTQQMRYPGPPPKTVYLAGPIVDMNKAEANDWREYVDGLLASHNIIGISPLRCEPLVGMTYNLSHQDPKFGTPKAIASKNFFDVKNCDMVIAYLPLPSEGRTQSYGTIIELAWAYAFQKQSIVVTNDPKIQTHPVVQACAGWTLDTLEDAAEVAIGILGGYTGGKNV